ncbi:hypothetical protein QAD02_012662 [Eretmocerus hayati]|uniref:Uncharacterized protein n=1 Tax=Eretmocerus hayati TaxID=131215 RepID=A0ACC2P524_9HYME|nr:hypothetical protein QAD02_012662 [Eretmocerus hayati]
MVPGTNEKKLARLTGKCLVTIDDVVNEKLDDVGLAIFTFNCQSLVKHVGDLECGPILQRCHVLVSTETWKKNEQVIDLPNFNCMNHSMRPFVSSGGVAIYQKSAESLTNHNPSMLIGKMKVEKLSSSRLHVGDICATACALPDGRRLIIVAIYISPSNSVASIIDFIKDVLLMYSENGGEAR